MHFALMIDIEIDMEDSQHEDSSEKYESVENNDITGSLDEGRVPHEFFLDKDDFNLNVEDVMKMEFDSVTDAERFYYTYAHGMGFSIRKVTSPDGLQMLEEHAASVYTKNAFSRFQYELRREHLYSCPSGYKPWQGCKAYDLTRYTKPEKEISVVFNPQTQEIKCDCKKFETEGIPCRHAINVMKMENLERIPDFMIVDQWKIEPHARHDSLEEPPLTAEDVEVFRRSSIRLLCNQVAEVASKTPEGYNQAMNSLRELLHNLRTTYKPHSQPEKSSPSARLPVGDPKKVQSKGRKKKKSKTKGDRKVYSCGKCGRQGHSVRTCPDREISMGANFDKVSQDWDNDYDSSDDDIFDTLSLSSTDLDEDLPTQDEVRNEVPRQDNDDKNSHEDSSTKHDTHLDDLREGSFSTLFDLNMTPEDDDGSGPKKKEKKKQHDDE
ncbi:Zinc finger, PMZ-type [Corchorus olitorius]|uniref:Protein FAR1-RELATED SEQUENCE n=1 Tax=Corchorus olitorius TaxID=93759 RepID=A0A1R3JLG7_9ROSI|nr:Zinc finger, PMZ-type [Corchorus olitorius]